MQANMIFGGFANNFSLWKIIIETIEEYPEIIIPNRKIGAIFDNFSPCTWNGGGHIIRSVFTVPEMMEISNFFNSHNIPIRLTMTNPMIEERDLPDRYANVILESCENDMNEVLVSNPLVEEFIRQVYPKYKICRSIIASGDSPYDLSDKYFMSVIRRSYNNDWKKLDEIPKDKRNKIELLCNESCVENCPRQYQHYKVHGTEQLNFFPGLCGNESMCSYVKERFPFSNYELEKHPTYISPEMIDSIYLPKGFCNFKIAGRYLNCDILEEFTRYMIKPEYQKDFRCMVWKDMEEGVFIWKR